MKNASKVYNSFSKERTLRVCEVDSEFKKVKISSSDDVYKYVKQFYADDIEVYESFFILLLNKPNNTIGWAKISQGGTCATLVDSKIILKIAIDSLADGVILVHNHPSGILTPSEHDISLTKRIKVVADLIGIKILDHIIISKSGFFSFADSEMI